MFGVAWTLSSKVLHRRVGQLHRGQSLSNLLQLCVFPIPSRYTRKSMSRPYAIPYIRGVLLGGAMVHKTTFLRPAFEKATSSGEGGCSTSYVEAPSSRVARTCWPGGVAWPEDERPCDASGPARPSNTERRPAQQQLPAPSDGGVFVKRGYNDATTGCRSQLSIFRSRVIGSLWALLQ